jgi:hypothetical protein
MLDNQAVDIIPSKSYLTRSTVLGVLRGMDGIVTYDAQGQKWKCELVSEKVKNTFVIRLLANTFYNPEVDVRYKWHKIGQYQLPEVRGSLSVCIDEDDDLLTQFVEGEYLKEAINNCGTFEDVYQTLNKYVFDAKEEEIWDEQGIDYESAPKEPVRLKWKLILVYLFLSPSLMWLALYIEESIFTFILGTISVFLAVGIWVVLENYFKDKKYEKTTRQHLS